MAATTIPIPMEARTTILERAHPPTPLPAEALRLVAVAKANLRANNSYAKRSRRFQLSSERLPFLPCMAVQIIHCTSTVVTCILLQCVLFVMYNQSLPRLNSFAVLLDEI